MFKEVPPAKGKIISGRNVDPHKGIICSEIINMSNMKYFSSHFKISLKCNWPFEAIIITMHCGVWNIYVKYNSTKDQRGNMKIYCCKVLTLSMKQYNIIWRKTVIRVTTTTQIANPRVIDKTMNSTKMTFTLKLYGKE